MAEDNTQLLSAVNEIRDLLRIMAEPAMAEHDKKARTELRRLVGASPKRAIAVHMMDGTRTQADIQKKVGINKGDLSVLVKLLNEAKLLGGDKKQPNLAINIPKNFFEAGAE